MHIEAWSPVRTLGAHARLSDPLKLWFPLNEDTWSQLVRPLFAYQFQENLYINTHLSGSLRYIFFVLYIANDLLE